jgi:hypothetical protein
MQNSTLLARLLAVPAIALICATASAELTCDQLGRLALSTERLRDEGYALPKVAVEIDKLVATDKFSASEAADIRRAVNDAFLRARTPNEIVLECIEKIKKNK